MSDGKQEIVQVSLAFILKLLIVLIENSGAELCHTDPKSGFTLIIHSICNALDFTFRVLFLVSYNCHRDYYGCTCGFKNVTVLRVSNLSKLPYQKYTLTFIGLKVYILKYCLFLLFTSAVFPTSTFHLLIH